MARDRVFQFAKSPPTGSGATLHDAVSQAQFCGRRSGVELDGLA